MFSFLYSFLFRDKVVAIDINSSRVNILSLKKNKYDHSVVNIDFIDLEKGIVLENRITDINKLTTALLPFFRKNKIKNSSLAFFIPPQDIMVKIIPNSISFLKDKNSKSANSIYGHLCDNSEKYFSKHKSEINIDYVVFDNEKENKSFIRAIGINKDHIKIYDDLSKKLGMKAKIITTESTAIIDYWHRFYDYSHKMDFGQCYCFIGFHKTSIHFNVIHNQEILTHDVHYFDDQENIEAYCNLVLLWISRYKQMFSISYSDFDIEKILLYGDFKDIDDIRNIIFEKFNIPIEILNPFTNLKVMDASIKIDIPSAYVLSCSLASRLVV